MTFIEIVDLFALYGVDVVVLAIITTAAVQILKTTVLKKADSKLYTALPFIIGIVLYFAYFLLTRPDFGYTVKNMAYIIEQGLTVGGAATAVYVIYEQFVRGRNVDKGSVVRGLLEGFTDGDALDIAAEEILKGEKSSAEILKDACPEADEKAVALLAKLLDAALKGLR